MCVYKSIDITLFFKIVFRYYKCSYLYSPALLTPHTHTLASYLELCQIDVESAVEAQRRRDGADNLTNQPVQVGVGRSLDVQVATAYVVNGLVVDHEGAVGVLEGRVRRQDRVVRLNDSGRYLWE